MTLAESTVTPQMLKYICITATVIIDEVEKLPFDDTAMRCDSPSKKDTSPLRIRATG